MKVKTLAVVAVVLGSLFPWLAEAGDKSPVIAIFLMESRGSPLKADEVSSLTDYMAAKLGEGGRFQVIPREEIKKHLVAAKSDSYKNCYDASCQIQIGKELAAEFSISSAISKVGSQCLLYASVWDLAKSTQIKSATVREKCDPELLITAVETISVKLEQAMTGEAPPAPVAVKPVEQPAPVEKPTPLEQPAPIEKPVAMAQPAGRARSKNLALASAEFNEGATVELEWFGTPGNPSDWVTVALAGSPDNEYWDYTHTGGRASGSNPFANLPVGAYEARLYLDWDRTGSYVPADRLAFTVVNASIRSLSARSKVLGLTRTTFARGETIPVHYFGTTGYSADWITIVPRGAADTDVGSYDYLDDVNGVWEAPGVEPGEYEARIYLNYKSVGYQVADRIAFQVR